MKKGYLIVVFVVLLAILGYVLITFFASKPREGFVNKNFAATEAQSKLGERAKAWFPVKDLDGDGQVETVAYIPAAMPASVTLADGEKWVKELSILKHTKHKTFRVLHLDSTGIFDERNQSLVPAMKASRYAVSIDTTQQGGAVYLFTQLDSAGNPQSEVLPVRFNAESGFYEAMLGP